MKRFMPHKQLTVFMLVCTVVMLNLPGLFAQSNDALYSVSDTLFTKMSVDELIQIREYFQNKVDNLRTEEQQSLSEGKRLGEGFLSDRGTTIRDRDKIYIRIAEYYIEDAERNYEQAYEQLEDDYAEYDRQLELFNQGKIETEPTLPETPKYDYSAAIGIYDKLLGEYPGSDFADDALYNKAWLLERMDRGPESRRIYQEVIDKYPDSPFAPESYIRLAEYFFNPRDDKTEEEQVVVELRKAIQLYKKVLDYRDSKRYDEALYKLGWSYYKLAARNPDYYDDSIIYFMAVADDITRAKKLDPNNKISNPDVRDEAIEYIGISFTDESYTTRGVDKARSMLERIGGRAYGVEIMRAIGQTYQKIDEQEKAIYAFDNLLEMYPMYEEAPLIQQKVVEGLYALGRDAQAYEARRALYSQYNPKSDWYGQLEQSDVENKIEYLDNTYKYTEAALRTNILLDLERAEETTQVSDYETFADHCKLYLEMFPADSNAYDINWSYAFMLDSRLGRFDEAFEEYITVSNDYLEIEHQHNAALNAAFMADTLVKLKYGVSDSVSFNLADIAQLSPEALTPEENRLIEAYDNYIRLFPDGEYTPNFLAAAGGIYYNHKKFAESKVYFQTLVKRFPGAEEKSLAMRSIMDSYFALGKFRDSEIIAKRILSEENISEEQRNFAAKRLAQAIFKNAEFLEEQGDYFAAANEFVRIYEEARTDPRMVQAALFNGGRNFENAKDWLRAIGTYDTLVTAYPQSEYAVESLERMADAYKELEQFVNVAATFERIFNEYRESEVAELSLYNASFYYEKGEDWENAIRVNNMYISNFPDQAFSVDLFFKNADHYLKMDNILEANRIYEEFAQRYPDDPRTVEAFYRRGNYYLDNGQEELAKAEYNKAIARSDQFRREGKDPNPFIAGEAVNKLADILHEEYVSIELTQPQSNIEAQQARMRGLLTELNTAYSKVLTFGSPRSFEATYNVARSYEEFATIYANQEINPSLPSDRQFLERKRINEESAALYDKAIEEYKNVVDNIPVVAERLGVEIYGSEEPETVEEDLAVIDTTEAIKRAAEVDSTRELAQKYHIRAQDKISELLYTKASLTTENIYQAVNVQSPSEDILTTIIFKVKLYQQAVNPAVESTIGAHLANIREAEAMGLSNKYVEESKRQILLTSNLLADEYEALTSLALDEFTYAREEIKKLIEREFEAVNQDGLDYYALDQNAAQMLDYSRILSEQVLKIYENTLILAEENNIQNDLVRNTEDRLLRFTVQITDQMRSLADSALTRSQHYVTRFDSTENYNYDDGRVFFENYYYSFNDNILGILQQGYALHEAYNIRNLWANKLLYKLIKLDPVTYSASIEKERVVVTTDETWKYSTTYYPEQWTRVDFDDSDWKFAQTVTSGYNQFFDLGFDPEAIWVRTAPQPVITDTSAADTTFGLNDTLATENAFADTSSGLPAEADPFAAGTDTLQTADPFAADTSGLTGPDMLSAADTLVFFRKGFVLDGTPVSGMFYVTADDDYRIYLNGEYLIDDAANNYAVVDTLDYYTIEYFVKQGQNLLAIDVEDKDLTAGGLKFYGFFEILPSDITAAAEERARVKAIEVDPVVLKKVNILNKNRISAKNQE